MNTPDPARLAELAARLAISPRQLLALAGRIAQAPAATLDAARLDEELARVRGAAEAAEAAADLALLGYGAYALDDVDRALGLIWSDHYREDPCSEDNPRCAAPR